MCILLLNSHVFVLIEIGKTLNRLTILPYLLFYSIFYEVIRFLLPPSFRGNKICNFFFFLGGQLNVKKLRFWAVVALVLKPSHPWFTCFWYTNTSLVSLSNLGPGVLTLGYPIWTSTCGLILLPQYWASLLLSFHRIFESLIIEALSRPTHLMNQVVTRCTQY